MVPLAHTFPQRSYGVNGVAVDQSGNVYATDSGGGAVIKVTPSGVSSTLTLPNSIASPQPYGVSVDGFGNIYITDGNNLQVVEQTTAGVTTEIVTPGVAALQWPASVFIDPAGKMYITDQDSGPSRVILVDPAAQQATFTTTQAGATSSDSPKTFLLANLGDQVLNISSVSYPTDFPLDNGNVGPCTSSSTVAAGQICDVAIDFTPTQVGNLSESVSINSQLSPKTIAVSGTATTETTTVTHLQFRHEPSDGRPGDHIYSPRFRPPPRVPRSAR